MSAVQKEKDRVYDKTERIVVGLREKSQFVAAMGLVKKIPHDQDRPSLRIVQVGISSIHRNGGL